jgi:hypothetical protein
MAATFGDYTATVTGTDGTLSHATPTILFHVVDFAISASAVTPSQILAGSSGTSTITVTVLNGLTGTVNLAAAASAGLTCTLPVSVTFGASPQMATLSCTAPVAGDYTVTVTGTDGTLSHSTGPLTFHFVDFTIAAGAVSPAQILAGSSGTSTITVTAVNGLTGTVMLSTSASTPTGLTCSLPASVTFGTSPQTATLSCSAITAGDYTVTVTGTDGSLSHTTSMILFHVVDFSISATSPAAVPADGTTLATSTVTVTGLNGFTGTVTLAATVPSGLTCTITASVTFGASPQTGSLSCSSTTAGTFNVPITGSSGTLTRSTSAMFNFNDFAISPSTPVTVDCSLTAPSSIPLCPQSTPIAASSLNGFTGMVTLTVSPSAGLTATLGKSTLDLTTGFDSTTLTLSASAVGTYTVTVTGMSGTLSHTTAIITLVVTTPDFTITASPTLIQNVAQNGGMATSTITIAPLGGFNGVVNLAATVNATGLTASLSPTSITMSGTSILTVTGQTAGSYLVTVTGTSGTITHSATVTVTVTGVQVSAPQFSQTNWKQRLQLSKTAGIQTWKFGVQNTDLSTTIFAQVQINVIDGLGSSPFTLTSQVLTLTPGQNMVGLTLTHDFSGDLGKSFTFQMIIVWGTSPTALTNTQSNGGTLNNIRTSGSFTVLP